MANTSSAKKAVRKMARKTVINRDDARCWQRRVSQKHRRT